VGLFRLEMAGGACWPLMMGGSGGEGCFGAVLAPGVSTR
jgi:hypothetical protein